MSQEGLDEADFRANCVRLEAAELTGLPDCFYLAAALAMASVLGRSLEWLGEQAISEEELAFARAAAYWSEGGTLECSPDRRQILYVSDRLAEESGRRVETGADEIYDLNLGPDAMAYLLMSLVVATFRREPTRFRVRGATHGDESLTFEIVASTGAYLLEQTGIRVGLRLKEVGYGKQGRGLVVVDVDPPDRRAITGLRVSEWAPLERCEVAAACSGVPNHIHQRQASQAKASLRALGVPVSVQLMKLRSRLPGSVVSATGWFGSYPLTAVSVAGSGRSAESVGNLAATRFRALVDGHHLIPPALVPFLLVSAALSKGASEIQVPTEPKYRASLSRICQAFDLGGVSTRQSGGGHRLLVS